MESWIGESYVGRADPARFQQTGMRVIGMLIVEIGGGGGDWVFRYPGRRGVLFLGGRNTIVLLLLTL